MPLELEATYKGTRRGLQIARERKASSGTSPSPRWASCGGRRESPRNGGDERLQTTRARPNTVQSTWQK